MPTASHSRSFDYRRRPETLRAAIATASGRPASVLERQDGNGRFVRQWQRRPSAWRCTAQPHAVDPHETGDVLELLLPCVLEGQLKLTLRVFVHSTGYADASGLGKALQTRSHIDAITEDVATLDDYVTLMNAHPELDARVPGHLGVPLDHPALDLDSAAEGIHDARELHKHAVAGGLDDPAAVLAVRAQQSERPSVRFP
jgi:hypothetical protein